MIFLDGKLLLSPIHNEISPSNIFIVTVEKNKNKILNTSIKINSKISNYKEEYWSYLISYIWLHQEDRKFKFHLSNKDNFEEAVNTFLNRILQKVINKFIKENGLNDLDNNLSIENISENDLNFDDYSVSNESIEKILMSGVDAIQDLYSDNIKTFDKGDLKGIFVYLFVDPVFNIKRNKTEAEKLTNMSEIELNVLERDIKNKVYNNNQFKNNTIDIVKKVIERKDIFFEKYM